MQERRFVPPLDACGQQPTFLHQFGQQRLARRVLLPVVVGEVVHRPHPVVACGEHEQFLARLGLRGHRPGEDVRRDDPLGEVVDASEVARTASGRDLPAPEEVLERDLAVVPVPPRALLADALLEVAGRQGTVVGHPLQHLLDVTGAPFTQLEVPAPLVVAGHVPAVQVVVLGGHVGGLVHPVLEQLAVGGRVGDERTWVWAEPGEQRQFLAAHQHVHRVDLDDADALEHAAQVPAIDTPGGARIGESLRRERDAACLCEGELDGHGTSGRRGRTGRSAVGWAVSRRR